MEYLGSEIWFVLGANLLLALVSVLVLWLISIVIRDVSIIDMFFGIILFAITVNSFLLSDGVLIRKQLLVLLVGIWMIRITVHLVVRNWGHGEDPRYSKLRTWVNDDRAFVWLSLRKVFLLQGIVLWFATLPVQFAQVLVSPTELGWLAYLGVAVWLVGMIFETVADIQLTRFRADPTTNGTVLKTGLWRYSRHPNYFGELCVWWGLFIIACENPLGVITIIGPILYSYLIVNITGQATLDKKLARERPGYKEYMQSTSGMIPMPPRK
jgi:steroid 5-alpha reductase family enzyme